MDDTYETYERNGCTITISYDNDGADNPLDWTTPEERGAWFCLKHSRYDLPNETNVTNFDDFNSYKEVGDALVANHIAFNTYKFVNWYEHSGIAVSLQDNDTPSDRWDAGIAGIILGESDETIKAAFADWKHYIEGDIYRFNITDADGDEVEDVGGYYGLDDCKAEADAIADAYKAPRKPERTRASKLHY